MGSSEPEGVFEGAVDRLGVVASAEEFGEAGVVGGDGSDVLGAVELAGVVLAAGTRSVNATVPVNASFGQIAMASSSNASATRSRSWQDSVPSS